MVFYKSDLRISCFKNNRESLEIVNNCLSKKNDDILHIIEQIKVKRVLLWIRYDTLEIRKHLKLCLSPFK